MTTQLSSLRVAADFDASGYTRGAQQKVDADKAMLAAMNDNIARQAAYTDALSKNTAVMTEVARANDNLVAAQRSSAAGTQAAVAAHEKHSISLTHVVSGYLLLARIMR